MPECCNGLLKLKSDAYIHVCDAVTVCGIAHDLMVHKVLCSSADCIGQLFHSEVYVVEKFVIMQLSSG